MSNAVIVFGGGVASVAPFTDWLARFLAIAAASIVVSGVVVMVVQNFRHKADH